MERQPPKGKIPLKKNKNKHENTKTKTKTNKKKNNNEKKEAIEIGKKKKKKKKKKMKNRITWYLCNHYFLCNQLQQSGWSLAAQHLEEQLGEKESYNISTTLLS